MKELDTVVLTHDIKDEELKMGDMGAIVHVYNSGKAYEVEFITADGKTVALLTLKPSDIRPMAKKELLHVRELSSVSSI